MQLTAVTNTKSSAELVSIPTSRASFNMATPHVLGIDIENAPDWYGGNDYVYSMEVCISHKFVGTSEDAVHTAMLDWRKDNKTILKLLTPLWDAMQEADCFLGHNFRHDWSGIQRVFRELEQPPLVWKPHIDTMRCIPSGIPRGLDNLCARFELGEKPHLTAHDWTLALRRRDPEKLALVQHRNMMDVILTERLYHKERELGWL